MLLVGQKVGQQAVPTVPKSLLLRSGLTWSKAGKIGRFKKVESGQFKYE